MDIDECVTKIATITQERNGFDFGMFGNNINYDRDNTINPQIIFLTNKGKLFTFGNDIYQNNQLNNNQQNNTLQSIKTLTNKNNNKLTIPSKNQLKKTNKISDNQNELPIKTLNNLISEKIIDIINGVSHCIIVTEKGNIFELTKQGLQLNCKLLLKNITNLKKIVCGMSFTIILTNDNRVFKNTWELYNPTFNLENNDELIEMACGAHHVLFLSKRGRLFRYLSNKSGQLGSDLVNYFEKIEEWQREQFPFIEKIIQLACGYNHTMLLTERGRVFVCGGNEHGQLGIGIKCLSKYELTLVNNFKKINNLNYCNATELKGNEKIIGIYANYDQSIFVTNFGNIFGCGRKLTKIEDNKEMNEPIPTQWDISAYRPDSSVYLFIYASINLIIILTRQKIDNTFILENLKHRLIDLKLCDITINH